MERVQSLVTQLNDDGEKLDIFERVLSGENLDFLGEDLATRLNDAEEKLMNEVKLSFWQKLFGMKKSQSMLSLKSLMSRSSMHLDELQEALNNVRLPEVYNGESLLEAVRAANEEEDDDINDRDSELHDTSFLSDASTTNRTEMEEGASTEDGSLLTHVSLSSSTSLRLYELPRSMEELYAKAENEMVAEVINNPDQEVLLESSLVNEIEREEQTSTEGGSLSSCTSSRLGDFRFKDEFLRASNIERLCNTSKLLSSDMKQLRLLLSSDMKQLRLRDDNHSPGQSAGLTTASSNSELPGDYIPYVVSLEDTESPLMMRHRALLIDRDDLLQRLEETNTRLKRSNVLLCLATVLLFTGYGFVSSSRLSSQPISNSLEFSYIDAPMDTFYTMVAIELCSKGEELIEPSQDTKKTSLKLEPTIDTAFKEEGDFNEEDEAKLSKTTFEEGRMIEEMLLSPVSENVTTEIDETYKIISLQSEMEEFLPIIDKGMGPGAYDNDDAHERSRWIIRNHMAMALLGPYRFVENHLQRGLSGGGMRLAEAVETVFNRLNTIRRTITSNKVQD